MPEVAAAPIPLHHRDEGSGPAVLLLHGLGGDHTIWNEVVPILARETRVLAPDLRGHGRTPAPEGSTFSFTELEGDLSALLNEAQLPRAHVVGLSAGGFLALRWGLDDPARLRSLTVINSAPHCDPHTRAVLERWAETYRTEGFDAYVLRLVKDLYYPDWVDEHLDIIDRLQEQLRRQDLKSLFQWGTAVRDFDLRGRLMKIRTPTHVVQSMDDSVVDGAHGRLLRVSIPGADLKLFVRTGHLLPVERPTETAETILEFVRRVESGAAPPPS